MRLLKKLSLVFLASVGALAAALLLTAVALIAEPQWFLTTRTVTRAVKVFGGAYRPRWKTLNFDIRSLNFPEKEIGLSARDLCFENAAAGLEGCLKDIDVRLSVRLYFWGAKLTKISRLNVAGDHFVLDQARSAQDAPPKKSAGLPTSLPGLLPAALRGLIIEALQVELPANRILQAGGGSVRAGLQLSLPSAEPRRLALKVELEASSGTVTRHYRGEGTLDSDLLKRGALTYLDASGRLKAEGVDARFQARVKQSGTTALALALNVSAQLPGRRVAVDLKGSKVGQNFGLKGSAGVWETSGAIKSVELKDCALEIRLKKDSTEWDALKFDGRFELEPNPFGIRGAGRSLSKKLGGRLVIGVRSTPGMLAADHFNAEVALTVKPVKDWYEFYGNLDARISGRASQVRGLQISHKLDFGLKVAEFGDLVEYLSRTPYSVPAPANVFHGPLGVTLKGLGDPRKEFQDFEYGILSGLAAGRQALKFEIKGKVAAARLWEPERSFRDETDVILRDIALQLPRFDIKGMANFIPDSRIRTGAESDKEDLARAAERRQPVKSSAAVMRMEIRVKTAKPALLYSNLAKDPIPVGLEAGINIPPGAFEGAVEVLPFRFEIFRRIATVDHIRLTGRAGSPNMGLDGLIVYKTAEAKIFIRLLGNVQKPQVTFESDPPMNQADIMAMLLFGKSPNKLDSDQQSSAANAQTAVSNSAFGLASLYLLASTPVEYVGYDPATRTYSVKFRLPGGATLQVGSDGISKGVQLRKRIASNLAIQTELTSTQTQGNVVTTLLEWYSRR
ncbi:MAG: translocation/assembly module TamB domain-containing protein [Elusimicrobia bacterium]|nr:translocation/assembly module TamB domain-containing protein [Elusimicrobiota bacterium]